MVHIEELFAEFQKFQRASIAATNNWRNMVDAQKAIDEAQAEFKVFCDKHGLAIDFTPRNVK